MHAMKQEEKKQLRMCWSSVKKISSTCKQAERGPQRAKKRICWVKKIREAEESLASLKQELEALTTSTAKDPILAI